MKKQLIFVFLIMVISVSQAFSHVEDCYDWDLSETTYSEIFIVDGMGIMVSGRAGTEVEGTLNNPPSYCFDYQLGSFVSSNLEGPEVVGHQDMYSFNSSVEVEHESFDAEPGGTYCVSSEHGAQIGFTWNDHSGNNQSVTTVETMGFSDACITIEEEPTPTPTVSPTPSPTVCPDGLICTTRPTVKITEVGFTGDRKIRRFKVAGQPYIDDPDGSKATWKSNNNPKFPVAYQKGTSPTLFAKFSITPALTTSQSVLFRIKKGATVVADNISASLSGAEISVPNISIPYSNLESGEYVKKGEYEFTWEISFDNGATNSWIPLDKKTKHDIHWLNSNPPNENAFKPFKDFRGNEYQGLFDFALEWSTGKNESDESDIKKVIQKINSKLAGKVIYEPGIPSIRDNPLEILNGAEGGKAVCADNALILRGLLNSIGITNQEKYSWGGDDNTGKRNYYCPSGGCTNGTTENPIGNRLTMQTKRDQLGCNGFAECVPRNPSFSYHATINYDGSVFDPSYGIIQGANEFGLLTAVKVIPNTPHQCVYNNAATELLVIRNSFGNDLLNVNNDTNKICDPILTSLHSGAKLFRFDEFGGADTSIIRPSTGQWIVQNEFQEIIFDMSLYYNPESDSLVPGDYDGDGITDPAVWYSNGDVYFRMSSNYYKQQPFNWRVKTAEEKVVVGDYDGDNISDIASWRPSDGMWIIRKSSDESTLTVQWGQGSLADKPVPGDYDNDGKTDIAVWRSSTGDWWILKSSDWSYTSLHWGISGDIPVQGDYDGDGTTDYAVVRPSTGTWYFLESGNGYQFRAYTGSIISADDTPVPADYNSDSKTDVAVWFKSSGMWQIVDSQTGEIRQDYLGQPVDIPVMSLSIFK